ASALLTWSLSCSATFQRRQGRKWAAPASALPGRALRPIEAHPLFSWVRVERRRESLVNERAGVDLSIDDRLWPVEVARASWLVSAFLELVDQLLPPELGLRRDIDDRFHGFQRDNAGLNSTATKSAGQSQPVAAAAVQAVGEGELPKSLQIEQFCDGCEFRWRGLDLALHAIIDLVDFKGSRQRRPVSFITHYKFRPLF